MARWIFLFQRTMCKHEHDQGEEQTRTRWNMSSTEQTEVAHLTAKFPVVDIKVFDKAEENIQYVQVNHIIEKPKIVSAQA